MRYVWVVILTLIAASVLGLGVVLVTEFKNKGTSDYHDEKIYSKLLSEDRMLNIRLPWDYEQNTDQRYPLIIKLDGDSRLQRHDQSLNILHEILKTPEAIIVAIPNSLGKRDRDLTPTEWTLDADTGKGSGEGDTFLKFIEEELIPYVEAEYRTDGTKVFVGYSRGGLLVMHSLIEQPGLFDSYIALSPSLWRDDNKIVSSLESYVNHSTNPSAKLYLAIGANENDKMMVGFNDMVKTLEIQPSNIRWKADIVPYGNHQTTPLRALPAAYAWILGDIPH